MITRIDVLTNVTEMREAAETLVRQLIAIEVDPLKATVEKVTECQDTAKSILRQGNLITLGSIVKNRGSDA